jgi:hypothetical protein
MRAYYGRAGEVYFFIQRLVLLVALHGAGDGDLGVQPSSRSKCDTWLLPYETPHSSPMARATRAHVPS